MKQKPRILITSAGSGPALSFIKALSQDVFDLYAVGSSPYLPGMYLVPNSGVIPYALDDRAGYLTAIKDLIEKWDIDIVAPMHDSDLNALASERGAIKCKLLLASDKTLELCLDKWKIYQHLEGKTAQPHTQLKSELKSELSYPLIAKPRDGSASEGFMVLNNPTDLKKAGSNYIVQELLPGKEYSVDVFANSQGLVLAAVVRERLRSEFGLAAASKCMYNDHLVKLATEVAELIGLAGIANIQFKEDTEGNPKLLEVNPRVPGAMDLTVASGANMPLMWVSESLSMPMPEVSFRPMAMIRQRAGIYIPVDELKE